jgi:hypothetical protein
MPASLTVGGVVFQWISLRGEVEPLSMLLEDVSRPGVDGHAYRQEGRRGRIFQMLGTADCATLALASAAHATLKARVGNAAAVVDDYGVMTTDLMLLDAERLRISPIAGVVGGLLGGGGQALLRVRLVLQKMR